MYDVHEDNTDLWPHRARYTMVVVRTAVHNMSSNHKDIAVITTGFVCKGIADLMADDLRPTALPPHYPRPLINEEGDQGSEEMLPWGEGPPP